VVDIGTSGLRAGVIRQDGSLNFLNYESCRPDTPAPGLVEFDPQKMAEAVLRVCHATINDCSKTDKIDAVGITNQRASTVMWSKKTGKPLGPGLGWQDLRTVTQCITAAAEHQIKLAPNQTATKAAWMIQHYVVAKNLDLNDVRIGTVDSWIASVLSNNELHVTDSTNAGATGLCSLDATTWSDRVCGLLKVDIKLLPRIVKSTGIIGNATALPGAPPIAALIGDQQSSLIGQGCIAIGKTKITFGTGGMLDVFTGDIGPTRINRSENGSYPIVAYSDAKTTHWAAEAIMLSAGTILIGYAMTCKLFRQAKRATMLHLALMILVVSYSCPHYLVLAHRIGITAHAELCLVLLAALHALTLFVRFSKASPTAVLTCSRLLLPIRNLVFQRCASTAE